MHDACETLIVSFLSLKRPTEYPPAKIIEEDKTPYPHVYYKADINCRHIFASLIYQE